MLLVDIVVIAVLDASWGAVDNLLWSGFVVLTPLALVLTSSALTRGVRRRWLAAPALIVLSVAMMAGLGLLADTAVQAWYGDNLGLVWEAPNWAFVGALLALGVAVLRRSQATSRAAERSSQEPALTSPES